MTGSANVQALGTSIHIDVSGNFNILLYHTMQSTCTDVLYVLLGLENREKRIKD